MKKLKYINAKTLLILTFVLLINISSFAQKKKVVTPKKNTETAKVVETVVPEKRLVTVYLKDGNELKGTFINASAKGIQILIAENTMNLKWNDIKQIIFTDDKREVSTKSEELPIREVEINKRVLKDYASYVKVKVDNKEVDLSQSFKVVVEGGLTRDGKFDLSRDSRTNKSKTQFIYWEGNEQIVDVAKKAIEVVGDSGYLGYLRSLGIENITFTLQQDGRETKAIITSNLKDAVKANTVSSGMNILIQLAKFQAKDDDKILLDSAQVKTEGEIFTLTFKVPIETAQAMINRKLKEVENATEK